jgi:RNA polymerase sigma-70 factor (sigma-E family)
MDGRKDAAMIKDAEFEEFFASQYGRLCWLGFLLSGTRAEAEELAQDALVRTWWRWAAYRRPDDPAAYARRVLVNRRRTLLRRRLLEARSTRRLPAEPVPGADRGEDAMVIWLAVRKLPYRQRAVLVLRYQEDLTEAEVARLLRLPLGTVKSLAHRGLTRLRAELAPADEDPAQSTRGKQ